MDDMNETKNISIRIDEELLKKIEADAKREHRNRSQQIIHMLTGYYKMKTMQETI